MKNFLLALLLIPSLALAGNGSGNVSQVVTVGGLSFGTFGGTITSSPGALSFDSANSQDWFTLTGGSEAITSGNFYPFFKNGVQYRVTTGKVADCFNPILVSNVAAAAQLVHSLTSWSAGNTLTGGVYQNGAAAQYPIFFQMAGSYSSVGMVYQFPSLSYPGIQGANANNKLFVLLTCRER